MYFTALELVYLITGNHYFAKIHVISVRTNSSKEICSLSPSQAFLPHSSPCLWWPPVCSLYLLSSTMCKAIFQGLEMQQRTKHRKLTFQGREAGKKKNHENKFNIKCNNRPSILGQKAKQSKYTREHLCKMRE